MSLSLLWRYDKCYSCYYYLLLSLGQELLPSPCAGTGVEMGGTLRLTTPPSSSNSLALSSEQLLSTPSSMAGQSPIHIKTRCDPSLQYYSCMCMCVCYYSYHSGSQHSSLPKHVDVIRECEHGRQRHTCTGRYTDAGHSHTEPQHTGVYKQNKT